MERIKLLKKDRKELIYSYCKNNQISLKQLSNKLRVNYSSLKQYARGDILTPINIVNKLCSINKIDINSLDIKKYLKNWGASKGGKIGIKKMREKYPHKLLEWRRKAGKSVYIKNFGKKSELKKIKKPELCKKLAEFIGIFLGDGTITRDFIRIFGDKRYDKKYFIYITSLIKYLFNLESKITEKDGNLLMITISSRNLCSFLKKEFSINYGDKKRNKTIIPNNILKDKELIKHCIRGLIDTDGCIGKSGTNLKLAFTSHNEDLLNQVYLINKKLDVFNDKKYINNLETCSLKKIKRYMNKIGSSNIRHIIRFNEKIKNNKLLYKKEVIKFYPLFNNIKLPFYEPVV